MKKLNKNKYFTGRFGKVTVDGEILYEIQSCNASITLTKEPVAQAGILGSNDIVTDFVGAGTFVINKVVTRGKNKWLEIVQKGETPTIDIIIEQGGPNTYGKEVVLITDAVPDEINLVDFDISTTKLTETINFTFNPMDAAFDSFVDASVLG